MLKINALAKLFTNYQNFSCPKAWLAAQPFCGCRVFLVIIFRLVKTRGEVQNGMLRKQGTLIQQPGIGRGSHGLTEPFPFLDPICQNIPVPGSI